MQEPQAIGCFGNCASGLSKNELNDITDSIYKTLEHPSGKEMFLKYLESKDQFANVKCLELYDRCSNILQSEQESSLEVLIDRVKDNVWKNVRRASYIDTILARRFIRALDSQSRDDLIDVLKSTRDCCLEQLRSVHEEFKQNVIDSLPKSCPITP